MVANALPSLCRWEPDMRVTCPDGLARTVVHVDDRCAWLTDGLFAPRFFALDGLRPDMSHAGTRGLVLEQVRVALGDPKAYLEPIWALGIDAWRLRSAKLSIRKVHRVDLQGAQIVTEEPLTVGRRAEGDALFEALHLIADLRAEGKL